MRNDLTVAVNLTGVSASLSSLTRPYVFNFTTRQLRQSVKAGGEVTLPYAFDAPSLVGAQPMRLVLRVSYTGGRGVESVTAFNGTVTMADPSSRFGDLRSLGLLLLLGAGALAFAHAPPGSAKATARAAAAAKLTAAQAQKAAASAGAPDEWLKGTSADPKAGMAGKKAGKR